MATYKKRGHKVKPDIVEDAAEDQLENAEQGSTTAEVFNTLDETASKSEDWVLKNQKSIFIGLGVVVLAIIGTLGYQKLIVAPKNIEASAELSYPKRYFDLGYDSGVKQDSLLNLGLNGANGKYGFLDLAAEYSGTDAGNLANYYAGLSYLKMNKYQEAIKHLEAFKSNDEALGPIAIGAIGDAFADINQNKDALTYYEKAAALKNNEFTTPLFLFKAGNSALELNDTKKALTLFSKIKSVYPNSKEASDIDKYIGIATYASN